VSEDQRNRSIEQALRQSLTAPAAGAATAACLDAETLAAWHDGALSGAERTRVDEHVADCTRCQALMATFVRTLPAALAPSPWWRRLEGRWLVPLATAAIVAAVYVALPDAPDPLERPAMEMATAERPAGSGPPPSAPTAARESSEVREAPKVTTRAQEDSRGLGADSRQVASPAAKNDLIVRQDRPAALADAVEEKRAAPAPSSTANVRVAPPPPPPAAAPAPLVGAAPPPRVVAEAPAGATAERSTAQTDRLAGAGAAKAAEPAALEGVVAATIFVATPSPLARAVPSVQARAEFAAFPSSVWRITNGEKMEYSGDGGRTWASVASADRILVFAGHSPSRNVAWFVGPGARVYLTTTGSVLTRVPFAQATTLSGVVAVNEREATVTVSPGESYRTTDGGTTWTRQ
jgi:hypothetical protein